MEPTPTENPLPPPTPAKLDASELYVQYITNKAFSMMRQYFPHGFDIPEQLEMNLRADLQRALREGEKMMAILKDPITCSCALCVTLNGVADLVPKAIEYQEQIALLVLSHEVAEDERREKEQRKLREQLKRRQEEQLMNPNPKFRRQIAWARNRVDFSVDSDSEEEIELTILPTPK